VKLTFLGTRGNIEERSERHFRHTSLMIAHRGKTVMIDCGADWLEEVERLQPSAIALTHAHPDHAWGLTAGAPCPVYATGEAWNSLAGFPIAQQSEIKARQAERICGIEFEAFPVEHSTRCPAVGYRVRAGGSIIFYAPDVAYIPDRAAALEGAKLYIGDGATDVRSLVRKRGNRLIGHAPMRTQITWCRKECVPWAIFTHCGKHIVAGDEAGVMEALRAAENKKGQRLVEFEIAYDGTDITV
jgi:phosphoribosyl 1,2-cyclic phosphodiesterase